MVLSDCTTNWNKKKLPEMIAYYEKQGCEAIVLAEL
jgi:hypothetical protein